MNSAVSLAPSRLPWPFFLSRFSLRIREGFGREVRVTVATPFLRRSRVSRAERCENNYDAAFDVRETPFVTLWQRAPLAAPTSGLSSCSGTELARSRNLSSFRTCRGPRRAPPHSPRRRVAVPSSHRFPALRNQTRRSRSIFFLFCVEFSS